LRFTATCRSAKASILVLKLPDRPRELPTLGGLVGAWIEANCAVPDGDLLGQPYRLTEEMWQFLGNFYALDPDTGRFIYHRGGQLVRPQKWGKGPFSAAIICAEAAGPVRFAGLDPVTGGPLGAPPATPWIQVTAVSEDQTANVWRALVPMIELGDIAADIPDTGQTRINLPGGGRIEPVTASARSRLGQRITFGVQDETHSWTEQNGGRALADNQRRNLAGMGGRWLETTNAWDPVEESVAQQTFEAGAVGVGVYLDDREPGVGSVRNKVERRRMLRRVYGDSHWVDLERIDGEIVALLDRDPAQAERFFLNRKLAGEDSAFAPDVVDGLERHGLPEDGSLIVVGVDGARFVDALAMVATDVESGRQWPLGIWERPERASSDYEHPFDEIDEAMREAFRRFYVWRAYVDPQYIEHLLDAWRGRWGADRVAPWWTHRHRQIAWAVRSYIDGAAARDWSHNGDPVFVRHLKNAKKRKLPVFDERHRQMFTLAKDRQDSPRKIDAAMAGVLSWEARGDAIAAGATAVRQSRAVAFL
jgi:hypothetical protein